MNVICHIAGPSGSGKSTLLETIRERFPSIVAKDLDEFDDDASAILGLDSTQKKNWDDISFEQLAGLRQKLMDDFISQNQDKAIVLAGFHTEDKHVLHIPTENTFLLDTSAEESARRAFERSQNEDIKYRRSLEDLPSDILDAQKEINFLIQNSYMKISKDEILGFIEKQLFPGNHSQA